MTTVLNNRVGDNLIVAKKALYFAVLYLLMLSQSGQAENDITYTHDPSWPEALDQFNWGVAKETKANTAKSATGIAIDRKKRWVYTLVRQAPHVRVFRENGEFIHAWSPENAVNVHMLHIDSAGDLWIADSGAHTVTKYSPDGKQLLTLGTHNQPGMDGNHFNGPTDVATTNDGKYVFVSDGYTNNRVVKFDQKGNYLGAWGGAKPGTAPGQFILPHSITVMDNRVYVADRSGARIQVFNLDGKFIEDWRDVMVPWGIASDNTLLYVIGPKLNDGPYPTTEELTKVTLTDPYQSTVPPVGQNIVVYDVNGNIVSEVPLPQGQKFGEVDGVHGIDISANGDIYLADVMGNHIQKWGTSSMQETYSPYANIDYPTYVYWGDTHLHSNLSFDILDVFNPMGKGLSRTDAYDFARGRTVTAHNSQKFRLKRPLDFLVIADHGIGIGLVQGIASSNSVLKKDEDGRRLIEEYAKSAGDHKKITGLYYQIISSALSREAGIGGDEFLRSVWEEIAINADKNNVPGKFTAFIAYEYSAPLNNHRVVIFKGDAHKARTTLPFTTYDSDDPEDLWQYLADYERDSGDEVFAIPHNGNLSRGNMFVTKDLKGQSFTKDYAKTRNRWEPLYEIVQIKGVSETRPALSPNDEFSDYMYWSNYAGTVTEKRRWEPYEYARSALKLGLEQQSQLGVNPFKYGFVGGTDIHTSLSAADENNFIGNRPASEPSAERVRMLDPFYNRSVWKLNAGGYTGVWASRNTRSDLFASMKRREVYATTGPRMTVRFFGGWDYQADDAFKPNLAKVGYEKGVPMGGDLSHAPKDKSPRFLIRAVRDPDGANLDRVQVIKGWLDQNGELHEKIYNVALSDDRKENRLGKVKPVGNTVDIPSAGYTNSIGDPELAVVWEDSDFNKDELAFYYVRVLEIPTPRWTAYDAKFFGLNDIPKDVPFVIQERAYTSPIWYSPTAQAGGE